MLFIFIQKENKTMHYDDDGIRVCGRDCEDCPEFENCCYDDSYDDGDSFAEEQYENAQFAQDDLPSNWGIDAEFENRISGYDDLGAW